MKKTFTVAIDGPSGAGKSSVARAAAGALGEPPTGEQLIELLPLPGLDLPEAGNGNSDHAIGSFAASTMAWMTGRGVTVGRPQAGATTLMPWPRT